jgi:hypothetical protein
MMIRLDDDQNAAMKLIAERNRRSKRKEVLIAIDFYIRSQYGEEGELGEQPPVHPEAA